MWVEITIRHQYDLSQQTSCIYTYVCVSLSSVTLMTDTQLSPGEDYKYCRGWCHCRRRQEPLNALDAVLNGQLKIAGPFVRVVGGRLSVVYRQVTQSYVLLQIIVSALVDRWVFSSTCRSNYYCTSEEKKRVKLSVFVIVFIQISTLNGVV